MVKQLLKKGESGARGEDGKVVRLPGPKVANDVEGRYAPPRKRLKPIQKFQVAAQTALITSALWLILLLVAGGQLLMWLPIPHSEQDAMLEIASAAPTSADTASLRPPPPAVLPTLVIPVAGVAPADLLNTFNDPRGGGARVHRAIDIMAPKGTPVIAAGPGIVERLFPSSLGGKTVYIRSHDGQMIHYYAHLDEYDPKLAVGQQVFAGDRLGTVGSTGNADPSAPHLHYALYRTSRDAPWNSGEAVNPYPLFTR